MTILFSWIGHIDLFAMCQSLPDEQRYVVLTEIKRTLPQYKVGPGAVKAMLDYRKFDRICLFSNYSQTINEKFRAWLDVPVEISTFFFEDPSSYEEIFPAVSREMERLLRNFFPSESRNTNHGCRLDSSWDDAIPQLFLLSDLSGKSYAKRDAL